MHQKDRRSCLDVSVKRGAVCNTDHNLVCMEFKLKKPYRRRHECKMEKRRFDVSQLRSGADGDTGCEAPVSMRFVEEVLERAHAVWPDDGNIDEQWSVFRVALTESAASVLGYEKKHQPDWFRESSDILNPFLQRRNDLYTTWLATGKAKDHDRFKQARGEARRAIRKAKNDWFVAKATEIERGSFGGVEVWRGIRDLQYGKRGLIPSRVVTIDDENGNPCCDPVSQQARWRRHFTTVLNICTHFDPQELDLLEQRPVFEKIAAIPSNNDVAVALAKVRNRKAPGSLGILPEMVKMGMNNGEFCDLLTNLLRAVWKEERVPQEWVDAILIPIPKKGNLKCCDNWRGISLLEVVGKVVARVVQNQLQELAEKLLPESQCGFRKGRGCNDMIFTIRQMSEKAVEHRTKQFFIFVDLRKAFDSVPREALWKVLGKLGVPEVLINIVKSFHENMTALIRLNGELLEGIDVTNGLRQGCTIAPTLFNLYSCAVTERWFSRIQNVEDVGTRLLYRLDQQLFRRSTSGAEEFDINECQFADEVALLATSRAGAVEAIREYHSAAAGLVLSASFIKTKFMVAGHDITEEDKQPIVTSGGNVECVSEFVYLGSQMTSNGKLDTEVEKRISAASRAFGALRRAVFQDRTLSVLTKRLVYQACVSGMCTQSITVWRRVLDTI